MSIQSRQGLFISWNPYVSYNGISLDFKGIWPRFQLWMDLSPSSDGVRRSALVQTNLVLYVLNDGTNSVAQNPFKKITNQKMYFFVLIHRLPGIWPTNFLSVHYSSNCYTQMSRPIWCFSHQNITVPESVFGTPLLHLKETPHNAASRRPCFQS